MKLYSLIVSVSQRLLHGWRRDPARDWLTLLGFAALFFSIILVWSIWTFDTAAKGGIIGSTPAPSSPALQTASLKVVQAIFASRATEEMKYASGTYSFVDPSH